MPNARVDTLISILRAASGRHVHDAHRHRQSRLCRNICGQKRGSPGVRDPGPGTVVRAIPYLRRAIKQAEESAHKRHGNVKEPGETVGHLLSLSHPPDFPRCPCAEIQCHCDYPLKDIRGYIPSVRFEKFGSYPAPKQEFGDCITPKFAGWDPALDGRENFYPKNSLIGGHIDTTP